MRMLRLPTKNTTQLQKFNKLPGLKYEIETKVLHGLEALYITMENTTIHGLTVSETLVKINLKNRQIFFKYWH